MILVHNNRYVRKLFDRRLNQMLKEVRAGILARACGGLQDNGAVGLVCGFHNRAYLLEVIYIKRRHAVAILGCVIE